MQIKHLFKSFIRKFGFDLVYWHPNTSERWTAGHYYSVLPAVSDYTLREKAIFDRQTPMADIDMHTQDQVRLLQGFSTLVENPPFYTAKRRFNIDNDCFTYDDAPILHYMLRTLRPARVIEIGSGHSSACMLDTNESHLGGQTQFTFIDINCTNLRKILLPQDSTKVTIIEQAIQDVDLGVFAALQAGDLLFIDSSHVMKVGSDLHTILFDILPRIAPGVCIHFHDVRYPFQYPKAAIASGIFWNEAYLLRAFLMNNPSYRITFWLDYLLSLGTPEVTGVQGFLPLPPGCRSAGGSIYLTKTA